MERQKCKICEGIHGEEVKHSSCPICGKPLLATSLSAVVDEKGKLWAVPYFGGKCKNCGWIFTKGGLKKEVLSL